MDSIDRIRSLVAGQSLHLIVIGTSLFIVIYSSFTVAGNAVHRHELEIQQRQLEQAISVDKAENQRLDSLSRYMQTDQFIEQAAREQEGLVRPNDVAIAVTAPSSDTQAAPPAGPWWEHYATP